MLAGGEKPGALEEEALFKREDLKMLVNFLYSRKIMQVTGMINNLMVEINIHA